jgi:hypothetical protein
MTKNEICHLMGYDARDVRHMRTIPGRAAPILEGERRSYYHTTPSGRTIVHSPRAYGYRTLYHRATWYTLVVGEEWGTGHMVGGCTT